MTASTIRLVACAGALATGLLLGGAGSGIAIADDSDSPSASNDSTAAAASVEAKSDGGASASQASPAHEPPVSTFGSGRVDIARKPAAEVKDTTEITEIKGAKETQEEKKARNRSGTWPKLPKFKNSLSIPVLRLPSAQEVRAGGWPDPAIFFDAVEVPVPTIDGFLTALTQPKPEPPPPPMQTQTLGPAFRGAPEAPVIDATGGVGADPMAAASDNNGAPPVVQLPVVVAPAISIPAPITGGIGSAPKVPAPAGTPLAGRPPAAATSAPTAAAGAKTPLIRGKLSPQAGTAKTTMTPLSGQATRVAYPRILNPPTIGQLAAVALPGVGGLMFLTFGGGVIGYRQANSIRFIRTADTERFLP